MAYKSSVRYKTQPACFIFIPLSNILVLSPHLCHAGFLTGCTETAEHCFLPAVRTPADSSRPSAINLVGQLGGFLDYGDLKIKIPFVLVRNSANVSLLLLGIFAKLHRSVGKATAFGMSCNFHVFLGKEDILRWSVWSSSCVWWFDPAATLPVHWCDCSQARRQTDFCKARLYRFTFVLCLDSRSCWQFLIVGIRIKCFLLFVCFPIICLLSVCQALCPCFIQVFLNLWRWSRSPGFAVS